MENSEFMTRLAKRLQTDRATTVTLSKALCQIITARAAELDNVALPGFGTFVPVKTDEAIEETPDGRRRLLPPSIRLTFTVGSRLKKTVNGK